MFFLDGNNFKTQLYSQKDFYGRFIRDLVRSKREIIIESPYITSNRVEFFMPVFKKLLKKNIKIIIITRDPAEHDEYFRDQVTNEILECYELGIKIILLKNNFHRKLAIIDRKILWEGSLNILSHSRSLEIMRRIEGNNQAKRMFSFLKLGKLI